MAPAYKWRADNSDADLVTNGFTEDITIRTANGTRTQHWFYPGRQDCLTCHTVASGGVLGVKTRQLNGDFKYPNGVTDNQLHTLGHLAMFDAVFDDRKIARYPRLANLTNTSAALELRVRSYLDANCSQCHRPGGAGAFFDTRFDTPLKKQNLDQRPRGQSARHSWRESGGSRRPERPRQIHSVPPRQHRRAKTRCRRSREISWTPMPWPPSANGFRRCATVAGTAQGLVGRGHRRRRA